MDKRARANGRLQKDRWRQMADSFKMENQKSTKI